MLQFKRPISAMHFAFVMNHRVDCAFKSFMSAIKRKVEGLINGFLVFHYQGRRIEGLFGREGGRAARKGVEVI